jgi:hypothetical protein
MDSPNAAPAGFPTDWPTDCPPFDAAAPTGEHIRIVRRAIPTADDFRSHRELGKLPKAPACLRAGLSMFRSVAEAERMALLFPVLGDFVARGQLDAQYGRSMLTTGREPSHTTVWPFVQTDRAAPFGTVSPVRRAS